MSLDHWKRKRATKAEKKAAKKAGVKTRKFANEHSVFLRGAPQTVPVPAAGYYLAEVISFMADIEQGVESMEEYELRLAENREHVDVVKATLATIKRSLTADQLYDLVEAINAWGFTKKGAHWCSVLSGEITKAEWSF